MKGYTEIKSLAEQIRFEFKKSRDSEDKDFALDIIDFAKHYGFGVYSAKLGNESGVVLISDKELPQFKEKKVILVNSQDSALRKRFTIAHELAHYFLHLTDAEKNYVAFRDNNDSHKDRKEKEADFFASNILMPENKVKAALEALKATVGEANKDSKIRFISSMFLVSNSAANVRLEQIGAV